MSRLQWIESTDSAILFWNSLFFSSGSVYFIRLLNSDGIEKLCHTYDRGLMGWAYRMSVADFFDSHFIKCRQEISQQLEITVGKCRWQEVDQRWLNILMFSMNFMSTCRRQNCTSKSEFPKCYRKQMQATQFKKPSTCRAPSTTLSVYSKRELKEAEIV